jgi:hypothetical protein
MSKKQYVKTRTNGSEGAYTVVRIRRTTLKRAQKFAKQYGSDTVLSTSQVLDICISRLVGADA